ncbi:uncharacterized protein LOC118309813 [Scophthalmus maximus]|uniref:C2H2-type domain-containing protein n=1 Tax=Scophthalmus maximus TaxID=52904 RepID=A0A6A4TL04_SCOMX|nr:uncharacterized protein LOC118309813 [Scophthalmus maximus]KAF0045915.1 hypothetical protein F2P81_002444 [Scophthalmus maximus]
MYVLCGSCYEQGSTGTMAEEGSVYEFERLQTQFQSLLSRYSSDELRADGKPFCSDFCKLVEEYACRWQVPLPQLGILELALRYFARASTFFPPNCDHVLHTLSSLALSVFELLLFFDQTDFHQEPLKNFSITFQECHLVLVRHQNVHLLQVERLVQGDGPWSSLVLQAILSDSNLPPNEVDGCISSELPVFLELRVRYLLSCKRVGEAMALAKCCARHPTAGQHLFFHQVYLKWLYKSSQHDCLHKEVVDLGGKDAVHIICSLECDEKDDLLLALSRAFLSQQLRRGDMYYLCDLVFVWSKLHSRLNTSKQALLEESHQLMRSATNVNSIFPFIRAILKELGEDGKQFCVELCAKALETCLPCDVVTKSLIYKTIAGLLPNDLEVCRACALLVFFLERTVDAYKIVYLLYMHPDQEYHVEHSPIANHVRFEMLQVLKKDLYFDPEFWNLIALRTNCLKLMSERGVSAALEEIMEDKWILNYCTKEPAFRSSKSCQKGRKGSLQAAAKMRHHKEERHREEDTDTASKRLKMGPGKTRLNVDLTVKKKGLRSLKDASSEPLRRSFWQLDKKPDGVTIRCGEHRRMTRLSEKNPPKRRIRKPKWLLEDSGTPEDNNVPTKIKKQELTHQKHHRSCVVKRSETGQIKNSAKHKASVNSDLKAREINKHQRGFSLDCLKPAPTPQVILELSLPDNELMVSFTEDSCNRFPQVLLYKPTVKLPTTSQPAKTVHRKEVILRARDETMFIQLLHCYGPRQKGKGNGSNAHGSVSTITRSSVQGSPPKNPRRERCGKPDMKVGAASHTRAGADENVHLEQTTKAVSRMTSSARELHKKPAGVKATIASKTSAAAPVLERVPQAETMASTRELCEEPAVEMKVTVASKTSANLKHQITASAEVAPTTNANNCNQNVVIDLIHPVSNTANDPNIGAADTTSSPFQDVVRRDEHTESLASKAEGVPVAKAKVDTPELLCNNVAEDLSDSKGNSPCKKDTTPRGNTVSPSKVSESRATYSPADQDSINDISALTLVTEMVTELAPEALAHDLESDKRRSPENSASEESMAWSKHKVPQKIRSTSICSEQAQDTSEVADMQLKRGKEGPQDIDQETPEEDEDLPETEESKLEYCCTFCNKDFKGCRVVSHAMFHYRRDECMFCGTMFKDDLLAMMHLSDHIEKLKKIKESAGDKVQENRVSETKGISIPLTSAKDKTTNMSSARRGRGRPRKTAEFPESVSLQDVRPSESRKLRSKEKTVDGNVIQEKKQNTSKHRNSETRVHKVNGHVCKKKTDKAKKDLDPKQPLMQQELSQERSVNGSENPGFSENQDGEMDSSSSSIWVEKGSGSSSEDKKEKESLQFLKAATKHNGEAVKDKDVEPQDRVRCPVGGCVWFKDLSKNRVALLYHALDDHYGEPKPLELAFRVGKSRCAICMRVLWSFEHFQHHVERHRLAPRHPCLHQGCKARFKTGMEMRRHARRHSPLQAVCCLPGCSQLFICLWALNLHEREHYASRPTKPDRIASEETGDKHDHDGKKQLDHEPKDTVAGNKTVSLKASRKLRGQATHNTSSRRHAKVPLLSSVRTSVLKQESKETKDSNVLKNLSNKDTSGQPTVPNLRLRQTLRKVTNTSLTAPKTHKVISSSLLNLNNRVKHKLKKHQVKVNANGPKRRGRPPKIKKDVPDENTSTGPNSETVKEKTSPPKDPNGPAQLSSQLKVAVTSDVSNSEQDQDVKSTETSVDESKLKDLVDKQIEKSHVKHKGGSHNTSTAVVTSNSLNQTIGTTSADKAQKLTAGKKRKMHKAKKRSAPKENGSKTPAAFDFSESKRNKVRNGKVNTKTVKKKIPLKETEFASKKTAKAVSAVPHVEAKAAVEESSADEDGKAKTQNADSTQNGTGDTVPAGTANEATAPSTSVEKLQRVTKEEKSKKPKEKNTKTASSDSGKVKKKCKDGNKKTDKEKQPCKGETSALKKTKKSKSVVQFPDRETKAAAAAVVDSPLDEVGKVKEEDATHISSGPSVPAVPSSSNEKNSPPTATEENTQTVKMVKKLKKSDRVKNSDPKKASKKRRNILKGDTKIVRKSEDDGVPSAKSETDLEERSAGETLAESPQCPISGPGYYLMNGQASVQDVISTVTKDALAMYGKRPYMRIPPTAYLDEKYITMPKRRKEMSLFQSPMHTPPPGPARTAAVLQRQRCANCFATFNSAEDLQCHLQLRKCSNLFGFDSDDEGNS